MITFLTSKSQVQSGQAVKTTLPAISRTGCRLSFSIKIGAAEFKI